MVSAIFGFEGDPATTTTVRRRGTKRKEERDERKRKIKRIENRKRWVTACCTDNDVLGPERIRSFAAIV